jgi:CAAX prenyl protease-like protein
MPIVIVGAGLIIGWLWVRTESIWMVALAHGALNNWGQYAFKFMGGPGQLGDGLVLGTAGLALLAVGSLLVARGLPSTSPLGASLGPPSVTAAQAFAAGGGRRDD